MATYSGLQTSYSNTYSQKTMITDRIIMASPYDITAIVALGLDNASKFRFVNPPNRTYSWLLDAYPATYSTALDGDLSTTTATVSIVVADGDLFHVGDVVVVDSEYMWVSAISTDTLTVTRGICSTTTATHSSTATMYVRGNARLEGADTTDSPWTEFTSGTNSSQIMQKEVNISRNDILFPNYGVANLKEYRIDKNMDILMEQLNKIPYWGKRDVGTATTPRMAGGFGTFVTTNATTLSSAALTRKAIDDEFQQIYAAGGKTDLILCDAWGQRKINDFYEGFVTTERSETIGGMMIKKLMHPITGQLVNVAVDLHCPAGYMYMVDTRHAGFITIDPFFYEPLSKTGDAELGQTVGEYGFVVAAEKFHSILYSYSTTS